MDLFARFRPAHCVLKQDAVRSFAFLDFATERDAEDALRALDAQPFMDRRLRVEFSRPKPARDFVAGGGGYDDRGRGGSYDDRGRGGGDDDRGRGGGYDDRGRGGYDDRGRGGGGYDDRGRGGYDDRGRGGYDDRRGGYDDRGRGGYDDRGRGGYDDRRVEKPRIARTGYRCVVTGLNADTAWQDLKVRAGGRGGMAGQGGAGRGGVGRGGARRGVVQWYGPGARFFARREHQRSTIYCSFAPGVM